MAKKINIEVDKDVYFSGEYTYNENLDRYEWQRAQYDLCTLAYYEGGVKLSNINTSLFYTAVPVNDFENLIDGVQRTWGKSTGGGALIRITGIKTVQKSTATKKIKWSK